MSLSGDYDEPDRWRWAAVWQALLTGAGHINMLTGLHSTVNRLLYQSLTAINITPGWRSFTCKHISVNVFCSFYNLTQWCKLTTQALNTNSKHNSKLAWQHKHCDNLKINHNIILIYEYLFLNSNWKYFVSLCFQNNAFEHVTHKSKYVFQPYCKCFFLLRKWANLLNLTKTVHLGL